MCYFDSDFFARLALLWFQVVVEDSERGPFISSKRHLPLPVCLNEVGHSNHFFNNLGPYIELRGYVRRAECMQERLCAGLILK
ncbi:Uncharacterised protein [Mycobacteroides abscessus subsp. abscessus]|nr:Uncharacterised protein [Mycobacteroides abscessus subsp. abscessus]SKD60185.1 Uncharacterised protein [Mycobacteroides abscessus subsp. abscessus]SKH47812.1 Uncharacterised protein [Mycobacteroides abscessus subsp. abscessus]